MKKVKTSEMYKVEGGLGYFWRCGSCGFKSSWHTFRHTAQTNADNHASIYSHNTAVYYG